MQVENERLTSKTTKALQDLVQYSPNRLFDMNSNNNIRNGGLLNSTSFLDVKFKKIYIGTIVLTNSHFTYYYYQPNNDNNNKNGGNQKQQPPPPQQQKLSLAWTTDIQKHQVSPVSHPKSLLKLTTTTSSYTFVMKDRSDLERIRRDITHQMTNARRIQSQNATPSSMSTTSPTKQTSSKAAEEMGSSNNSEDFFGTLSPTALAVTRSSLLSSNPSLKAQHEYLVKETCTLSEDDFWSTHEFMLADEYAKIYGKVRAGMSCAIKSNLEYHDGNNNKKKEKRMVNSIRLGVEEMRQIFILYPAVHKAYETKVPLELSEEQFWRKYLESEYFHRDRGRIGSHIGKAALMERLQAQKLKKEKEQKEQEEERKRKKLLEENEDGDFLENNDTNVDNDNKEENQEDQNNKKQQQQQEAQENARVAAVGTDDIFSRLDVTIQQQILKKRKISLATQQQNNNNTRRGAKDLAIGQFDLLSTTQTERGNKLLFQKDYHPHYEQQFQQTTNTNNSANGKKDDKDGLNSNNKGARVIDKYNCHWAMVLHPEDATAGCDLKMVARQSVHQTLDNNDDAKVQGGNHQEMNRLVQFANESHDDANHVMGLGEQDSILQDLTLPNIHVYQTGGQQISNNSLSDNSKAQWETKQRVFAQISLKHVQDLINEKNNGDMYKNGNIFPNAKFGSELLGALTKRMVMDSKTESEDRQMTNALPEDFKKKFHDYFRRSSELLKHFFGIRNSLEVSSSSKSTDKLQRIVKGMEGVYREMEGMRKTLPTTPIGETMRKMCLPIMDQLDWAFKLHREGAGGGGGGFVTIDEF